MNCHINRDLLPNKLFYFFFFGGTCVISIFLPHLLKQRGFSPVDVTTILGIVPFVVVFSKPLLGHIADLTGRAKQILLTTITVGLISMGSILFVPGVNPEPRFPLQTVLSCFDIQSWASAAENGSPFEISSTAISEDGSSICNYTVQDLQSIDIAFFPKPSNASNSSQPLNDPKLIRVGDLCAQNQSLVWLLKCQQNDESNPHNLHFDRFEFWLLFLLIVAGNAFGLAPSYTIVDAMTLRMLKNPQDFGKQRMPMSIGISISVISIALVMDGLSESGSDVNYLPCFIAFLISLVLCLIDVTFFKVPKRGGNSNKVKKAGVVTFLPILRHPRVFLFCLITLMIGFNFGPIAWLSVWHLKELGARQITVGLSIVVSALFVGVGFFLSGRIIKRIGFEWTAVVILTAFSLRDMLWSFFKNPWLCVPCEVIIGTSFGLWLSNLSQCADAISPKNCSNSGQAVMAAFFDGFGVGIGNLISGWLVQKYGGAATWRILGIMSFTSAIIYGVILIGLQRRIRLPIVRKSPTHELPTEGEEMQVLTQKR